MALDVEALLMRGLRADLEKRFPGIAYWRVVDFETAADALGEWYFIYGDPDVQKPQGTMEAKQ